MKTRKFIVAVLALVTTGVLTAGSVFGTESGPKEIQCPTGDKYKCYTWGSNTVYKGEGGTVIIM
ncbi:MAG: hypothetical protein SFU20_11525 [Chitinophagaceae bacterium]|nr:hypothetical protein [Chitinophagaceae bacterium]